MGATSPLVGVRCIHVISPDPAVAGALCLGLPLIFECYETSIFLEREHESKERVQKEKEEKNESFYMICDLGVFFLVDDLNNLFAAYIIDS